jgi:hypothetical protein
VEEEAKMDVPMIELMKGYSDHRKVREASNRVSKKKSKVWSPRWVDVPVAPEEQVPVVARTGLGGGTWNDLMMLRKGSEWPDFQFLTDAQWKDHKWEATMAR